MIKHFFDFSLRRLVLIIALLFFYWQGLLVYGQTKVTAIPVLNWTRSPFEQNVFIENKGQFNAKDNNPNSNILFGVIKDGMQYYFSPTGLTYRRDEAEKMTEKQREALEREGKEQEDPDRMPPKLHSYYVNMEWLGANSSAQIIAEEPVSNYYTYPNAEDKTGKSGIRANACKKIVYKNLYPNIDVEYTFPKDKAGIKYSIILHPGADASLIKMKYSGDAKKLNTDKDGNIRISTPFGSITDHAPQTIDGAGSGISSAFSLSGKMVAFKLAPYQNNQAIIIDPWTTAPPFTGNLKAFGVDYDVQGNAYIYGGNGGAYQTPNQVTKLNKTGLVQWTFVGDSIGISDLSVNKRTQSVYFVGPPIKLNVAGVQIKSYPNDNRMTELWRMKFNPCSNQCIIGGGGVTLPNQAAIIDTNMVTLNPANVLSATKPTHDVNLFALDHNNNCYMSPMRSGSDPGNFDNVLVKVPATTLSPPAYMVPTRYTFQEAARIAYSYPAIGYNGIAVNSTYLYTYDASDLKRWNAATGVLLDSVRITPQHNTQLWGGLTANNCDIFVGVKDSIYHYDQNLNFLGYILAPDSIYDLKIGQNNTLYACGNGFVSSYSVPLVCASDYTVAAYTTTGPSGCNPYNFSFTNTSTTADTYNWDFGDGQSSSAVSPSHTYTIPGIYKVKLLAGNSLSTDCYPISHDSIVQTITIPIAINITGTPHAACFGNSNGSVQLTVSGGVSPYSYLWSNAATSQNPSGLTSGNYSVTLTDANGCTGTASFTVKNSNINLSGVAAMANCQGSIALAVSGDSPPFGYLWNNGATAKNLGGLSAGTYSVSVTDSLGCQKTASYAIAAPNIVITGTLTNSNCAGNIALSVSGNYPRFTYLWSNGVTSKNLSGLSAGNYTITITDSVGCKQTASYAINNFALNVSGTTAISNCQGSVTLTVTGNHSPYSYLWSNGATTQNISGVVPGNYAVTVSDAVGCSSSPSFVITNNSLNLSGLVSGGNCLGKVTLTMSGNNPPFNYLWSNGATTKNVSGLAVGNYTVSVTDAAGCQTSAVYALTSPNLNITGTSAVNNCLGSIVLTVSGNHLPFTYKWSNGALSKDINALPGGNYTITVTDNYGCTQSQSFNINNNSGITINGTTGINNCQGTVTSTVTGNYPPFSYLWNNGATTQNISGLSNGVYSLTASDVNGCAQLQSFTINNAGITIASTTSIVNCLGKINVTPSNGNAPYTYSWSNGATTSLVSGLSVGSYTVSVTDNIHCSQTKSFNIINPVLSISGVQTGGCGGNVTLSVSGGNAPYSYLWSNGVTTKDLVGAAPGSYNITVKDANGCGQSQTFFISNQVLAISGYTTEVNCAGVINLVIISGSPPYTFSWSNGSHSQNISNLANGTYAVTVSDANGCVQTQGYNVSLAPALAVSGSVKTNNCQGAVILNVNGSAPYTYSWSNGATTKNISGLSPGTYTVTVSDLYNCQQIIPFVVNLPALTLSGITPYSNCLGNINLSPGGGTSPYTYSWSNGSTTQNLSGLSAGAYTVTLSDANSCSTTQSFTINIAPITITGSVSASNCLGAINVVASGGSGTLNYLWSNGAASSPSISGLSAGTYSVTVSDVNGCSNAKTFAIGTYSLLLSTSQSIVNCTGSIALSANGTPPYTYQWNNGATIDVISNLNAGSYSVTVNDANGCKQTASASISLNSPNITLQKTNADCNGQGGAVALQIISGTNLNYRWSNGAISQNLHNITAGNYSVTVTDAQACSQSAAVVVGLNYVNPVTSLRADKDTLLAGESTLLHLKTLSGYQVDWQPPVDAANAHIPDPLVTPNVTTTYTVKASNFYCSQTTSIVVFVKQLVPPTVNCKEPYLFIPNAFSPNGDGNNDILYVYGNDIKELYLAVYNDLGEKVFETTSQKVGWDGTFKGGYLQPGVYDFYLKIKCNDDQEFFKKGDITLLR